MNEYHFTVRKLYRLERWSQRL